MSASSLVIRLAEPKDYKFVSNCMRDLTRICLGTTKEVKEIPTLKETFDKCIKEPKFHPLFIADIDGKPSAICSCNLFPTPEMGCLTLNIANLVVDKSARGKGLGAKIINFLKKYARENDIKALELITPPETSEKHTERLKFYHEQGFDEIGPGFVCPLEEGRLESAVCE